MAPALSRRLSPQDASFLYFERDSIPLQIGSIAIFEGQLPFERFVEQIASRIHLIPRYRQRVVFPPFNLAHPTWEWDPVFDILNHIHKADVPSPVDDRALAALAGEFFAKPLSRDKPLWEMVLVEGLPGDRSALVSKVHHCLVDGVAGIELLMITLDISPNPPPTPPPHDPYPPEPVPDPATLLTSALRDRLSELVQAFGDWQTALIDPLERMRRTADVLRSLQASAPFLREPAPRLPFNRVVQPQRYVAWTLAPFTELRGIRSALGGTVNDVVLAIVCGALRRYLLQHGISCDGPAPRVGIPVNVRQQDETGSLGNRVSMMLAALPVSARDPVERFHAIRDHIEQLKRANQAAGFQRLMDDLGRLVPVPLQALGGALPQLPNTLVNLVCTNVPGPMIPLYSIGHRLLANYPLVPLGPDLGLGVGVTSYDQRLYFGLMADPAAVPDLDKLRAYFEEAYLELRLAAGVPPSDLPSFIGPVAAEASATPGVIAD
ncbi:MAG: wax ester/triacylglycerol synthase family O-acyltransferase [Chloroflexi bacterium]|nr:wax ester/triacylglycerol synthase family O-acyltransferase [Chloroflexota bacterium]